MAKNYLFAPFKDDDDLIKECHELQADNVAYINDFAKLIKDNDKLKAENKDLIKNAKVMKADLSCKDDSIMDLKAENCNLINESKWDKNKLIKELQAENQEHKQCREDAVKHYPKEYKAEAEEYFEHNPKSKGVRFHMIDFSEYDYDNNDGLNGISAEYDGVLYADDCIVEIDN